eukprot:1703467-Amphidinium_carterae.7
MAERFESGIWVGRHLRSDEHIVAEGRKMARTVKRRASDDKQRRSLTAMHGAIVLVVDRVAPASGGILSRLGDDQGGERQRKMYVTKRLVQEFGATEGCPACEQKGRVHTKECRDRLEI